MTTREGPEGDSDREKERGQDSHGHNENRNARIDMNGCHLICGSTTYEYHNFN